MQVKEQYPSVRIVEGDLDSGSVIEKEVEEADIVFRMLLAFRALLSRLRTTSLTTSPY